MRKVSFLPFIVVILFLFSSNIFAQEKTQQCVITGCSGQICADQHLTTTCEYKAEYACYKNARCERQANGQCGWTQTQELLMCLENAKSGSPKTTSTPVPRTTSTPTAQKSCVITGCSGQICSDREVTTTCEYKAEYACYKNARCERQANGQCGWTQTQELLMCLENAKSGSPKTTSTPLLRTTSIPLPQKPCVITGCSRQICSDREVTTTCEYKAEYACYKNARCERQANGQCGWTQTIELQECLTQPPQKSNPTLPTWIQRLPLPIRNFMELLYVWINYFGRTSDKESLLLEQKQQ